jgi:hypothetical protein
MWFLVGAVIVIALFALWFRRTPLYRTRSSGREVARGQGGWDSNGHQHGAGGG